MKITIVTLGRRWLGIAARSRLPGAILALAVSISLAVGQTVDIRVAAADDRVPTSRISAVEGLTSEAVTELGETFPGTPYRPFTVIVHADASSLPEAARASLHAGTPGMALLGRGEIHILLDRIGPRQPGDLRTVVVHEVVHELLDQYAGEAARFVPRWLHEGLAQVLSGDTYLGSREEDLVYPAATGRLLRFTELREDFPEGEALRRQAYAQSYSFVGFLCRRATTSVVVQATRRCREDDWYRGAFAREAGYPMGDQLTKWEHYLIHESGANWRFLFNNCFAYLMIAALVPLALAGIRRWTRDSRHRDKLEREERMADEEEPRA